MLKFIRETAHVLTSDKGIKSVYSGSTDYPTFFLQGGQFKKLVIRQCLGVKGLRVEIVSFVLFINCSFYRNQFFSCFNFWLNSPKYLVIVQKLNLFLSTGC